jgi:hypothetical protein
MLKFNTGGGGGAVSALKAVLEGLEKLPRISLACWRSLIENFPRTPPPKKERA